VWAAIEVTDNRAKEKRFSVYLSYILMYISMVFVCPFSLLFVGLFRNWMGFNALGGKGNRNYLSCGHRNAIPMFSQADYCN
jgi:hypothetical protein